MAERIVSPGVFTRERDLSFLPQAIGAIGAAIVGPTSKGPAFVPIVIRNGFSEFINWGKKARKNTMLFGLSAVISINEFSKFIGSIFE